MKLESVVSISSVIFSLFALGFSIFTFFSNKIEKDTMRLNQVVIEKKTNKILVGTTEVQYDVTLRNMSDTTIKDVHLIAPGSITEIRGDAFQFENGHLTRLLLGDLGPSGVITKTVKMQNSTNAQIKDFSMEFKDYKGKTWLKEPGKNCEKINKD